MTATLIIFHYYSTTLANHVVVTQQTCCVSMTYFLGDSMCCLTTSGGSGVMMVPCALESWEVVLGRTAFISPPCTSAIAHTIPSRGTIVWTSTRHGRNGYGSLDRHHSTSRSLPGAVTSSKFPAQTAIQLRKDRVWAVLPVHCAFQYHW